jgi:hypothetical protein
MDSTSTIRAKIPADCWFLDGWNVSAFDFPIVACGCDELEARSNFKDAVAAHFETMVCIHGLDHVRSLFRQIAELGLGTTGSNVFTEVRIYLDRSVTVEELKVGGQDVF